MTFKSRNQLVFLNAKNYVSLKPWVSFFLLPVKLKRDKKNWFKTKLLNLRMLYLFSFYRKFRSHNISNLKIRIFRKKFINFMNSRIFSKFKGLTFLKFLSRFDTFNNPTFGNYRGFPNRIQFIGIKQYYTYMLKLRFFRYSRFSLYKQILQRKFALYSVFQIVYLFTVNFLQEWKSKKDLTFFFSFFVRKRWFLNKVLTK